MRHAGEARQRLTGMRPPALVRRASGSRKPCALPTHHAKVTPCRVPSAECEEPDVFSEPSLGEELGSPCRPGMPRVGKAARKAMAQAEVGALHQHIQDLKVQLLNANKVIQSLQRRARSISVTSGYTSGAERPLPGPTALASPAHSLTDEDEGWQSDGHGTLCPPALRAHRDLQRLVHRVALLEAQLPTSKPGGVLPKELQSATWPGYGHGDRDQTGSYRGCPRVVASRCMLSLAAKVLGHLHGGAEPWQWTVHRLPPWHPDPAMPFGGGVWQPCGPPPLADPS